MEMKLNLKCRFSIDDLATIWHALQNTSKRDNPGCVSRGRPLRWTTRYLQLGDLEKERLRKGREIKEKKS